MTKLKKTIFNAMNLLIEVMLGKY